MAALTKVFRVDRAQPLPVFVDETGRRQRRLRRLAALFLGTIVLLLAVVWLTQFGGAVRPHPVSPCGTPAVAPVPSARPDGCGP